MVQCGKVLPVATEEKASEDMSKEQPDGSQRDSGNRNGSAKKARNSKDKMKKETGVRKKTLRLQKAKKGIKRKKEQKSDTLERVSQEPVQKTDDGYDGYYDDILPADEGRFNEGIDKKLVKNVVILISVVLLIVIFCVMGMYLL